MRNVIIILDPAHGADVAGKRSPDGKHREYKWSRERISRLETPLRKEGFEVYRTTTSLNEPGLSRRKNFADQIRYGKRKLLLSLHNNAAGSDGNWHSARGASIYTTKGVTNSDVCADIILREFEKDFPDIKIRRHSLKKLDGDFEENFTVLMGSSYMACLIEWLFQDNKEDVRLLGDMNVNARFEESLLKGILEIDKYFEK